MTDHVERADRVRLHSAPKHRLGSLFLEGDCRGEGDFQPGSLFLRSLSCFLDLRYYTSEGKEQDLAPPEACMASAFTGIRILDFTQSQQGPSCTVLLSDRGAEVITVEPPGGAPGRSSGRGPDGYSAYFEAHNRGKKAIVLNMRTDEAKEIVRRL